MAQLNKIEKSGVKIKLDVIMDSVIERLRDQFTEELKSIDIAKEREKIALTDELAQIYKQLKVTHPKYYDEFNRLYTLRCDAITPNFKPYVGYSTQVRIKNKLVEYILNNNVMTFDAMFEHITKGITLFNKD